MPEVSVIMPIYNTQQYLNQSVRSVLNQSFENFELICVNDGSTDYSLLYLNSLARIDHRIKILDLPHGGVTTARIEGIRAAKGSYIGFVDSDDWVDADYLLHLYSAIRENHADISMVRTYNEGKNGAVKHRAPEKAGVYRADDLQHLCENLWNDINKERGDVSLLIWDKLFRAELIKKNVCYLDKNITLGEDNLLATACLLDCQCFVITDSIDYHYRARGDSIVHTGYLTYENVMLFCSLLRAIFHQKGYAYFDCKVDVLILRSVSRIIRRNSGKELPPLPEEFRKLIEAQSGDEGCEGWRETVAMLKEYIHNHAEKQGGNQVWKSEKAMC